MEKDKNDIREEWQRGTGPREMGALSKDALRTDALRKDTQIQSSTSKNTKDHRRRNKKK